MQSALGPKGHKSAAAEQVRSLGIAILTVSDTRTEETDTAGALLREQLAADGHRIADRAIVPDEADRIREVVTGWLGSHEVDVVITTGGTGISRRDCTVATLRPLVDREVPGFGEVFRWLSYEDVGGPAMLSGAFAGVAGPHPIRHPVDVARRDGTAVADGDAVPAKLVIALPGSKGAVRLALEKLLLPELRHLVWEVRR